LEAGVGKSTSARPHRPTRILARQSVSQVPRATSTMGGERLFGEYVELAGLSVSFNRGVEMTGLKGLEPRTKAGQFARIQLLDGFFNFFCGCHGRNIASARGVEKPGLNP